jgi:hypothetical protein
MVVSAVATFDGKALAKGSKQISAFAKKAAGSLGLAFSTAAVINYGKASVKAFADNEKSAKRLANAVTNLGQAFELPGIERNLSDISAKFGYEGEVLREAFQKLITTTGSATKAQELLNLSLDVAAGSGEDLLTVNQDLAAAYVGQTRGLRKYNLGLTQAELKTLDFDDAVNLLGKSFKGAAGQELTTFSGKMRVLGEAADNAQEIIGTGLVDALSLLAGEGNSIQPLADSMEDFSTYVADAIVGVAVLVDKLDRIPGTGKLGGFSKSLVNAFPSTAALAGIKRGLDALSETGAAYSAARKPVTQGYLGSMPVGIYESKADIAKRNKIEADRIKNEKRLAAERAKAARAEKQKLALTKASAAFDTTRISLAAALKATYDKETKLRLEALMLIEEDRGDEALKKIDELAKFQKNADMQRLAGVTEISNATLESLNKQLITELRVVEQSKLAESDKEIAREQAFSKYNAAITAAGTLMAKEAYSERVQIQLTEIARLASISATTSAANTAALLIEANELGMIDRVAKAQEIADAARLKALNEYAAALGKIGGPVDFGGNKLGAPVPNFVPPEWTKDLYNMSDSIELTPYGPVAMSPSVGGGGNTTVELTVNTGIGDPEAIARAIEDTLNQSTYRGTSVNRNTGFYAI